MLTKVASIGEMLITVLRRYPAMSAALVNFGVFVAGYFGLHITAAQLVGFVGVLDVLFGIIVHSNVVPLVTHQEIVDTTKANVPVSKEGK
jgi:hypothetical protein